MKTGKKWLSMLLVLAMAVALCGGALAAQPQEEIVVLYTNDVHCGLADGIGYAGLAAYEADMLDETPYVTLVDAGDAIQGGPIGTLSEGGYLIEIMNALGYDVAVPGNHEFDYGMDRFQELAGMLTCGYVCCNLIDLRTGEPVFDAYRIIEYGDTRVAYVGISTPESITKSTPAYFQDENGQYIYSFCNGQNGQELYDAVQAAIDAARAEQADYVIAVGHCGTDAQSAPWRSTDIIANVSGLDAFIDAHSHSTIASEPVEDRDGQTVLLTSTGTKLAAIGKLVIAADGTITTELVTEYTDKDADTEAMIAAIEAENAQLLNQVVASSAVTLTGYAADGTRLVRNQETNIGDLVADAYRVIGGADIGWVNGGGIRADIEAGEITYGEIIDVHPYNNELYVVEATGQEILDALEMASSSCPDENGGFLSVSGLTYTVDTAIPSSVVMDDNRMFVRVDGEYRVRDVMVGGEPLELDRVYTLASHNYMLRDGGDGINMFMDNPVLVDGTMLDNEVLIRYITDSLGGVVPESYAQPQGRIQVISRFYDVTPFAWYNEAVLSVCEQGLMEGTGDGNFSPDTSMTRAMLATMLYRLAGSPAVEGDVSAVFSDCQDDSWYADAVLWASQNGIVEGVGDGRFSPARALTRQEMAAVLYRYACLNGAEAVTETTLPYADAQAVADWAVAGVQYCTEAELMQGVGDNVFNPAGSASRAMGATVLSRLAA